MDFVLATPLTTKTEVQSDFEKNMGAWEGDLAGLVQTSTKLLQQTDNIHTACTVKLY